MKKALLATAFLGLLGLAAPRPTAARVSVFVGLPGFALFAGPPVAVGPSYYGPAYYAGPPYWRHGKHLGWYKHGWHGGRNHEGDWDN